MRKYFPKQYGTFGYDINVKVDLSNYATKGDLKNATGIDASNLALKSNLASLKAEVDKIDVDKLKYVPVDLSKLNNDDVVKKTVNDKLVAKVKNTDTSGFVLKTKYNTDKSDLGKKIPDVSHIVKKTDCNAKVTGMESKIPSITGLATNVTLTSVENKTPDASNLVKKTDYGAKTSDLNLNILLQLITKNLQKILLIIA